MYTHCHVYTHVFLLGDFDWDQWKVPSSDDHPSQYNSNTSLDSMEVCTYVMHTCVYTCTCMCRGNQIKLYMWCYCYNEKTKHTCPLRLIFAWGPCAIALPVRIVSSVLAHKHTSSQLCKIPYTITIARISHACDTCVQVPHVCAMVFVRKHSTSPKTTNGNTFIKAKYIHVVVSTGLHRIRSVRGLFVSGRQWLKYVYTCVARMRLSSCR